MSAPAHARVTGHFGEYLQGLVEGEVALVTLPCRALAVEARWRPARGRTVLHDPQRLLPARALSALFRASRISRAGCLHLRSNMRPGAGSGASTAALVALARVLGIAETRLPALCLALEGASDPLMHPAPGALLWAPRAARALASLPPAPAFHVVGGLIGPPRRTDPADRQFPDITDLAEDWVKATGDPVQTAALARESARRTARLRSLDLGPLERAAQTTGALGFAIAHTGGLGALLLPSTKDPTRALDALRREGIQGRLAFRTGGGDG